MKKVLKNKRKSLKLTTLGFTLVELLAVVVLLAIVALIATPIIGNVIETSEESANQRSIEGYADAIRNEYYNQQTGGGIPVIDDAFLANIDTEGNEIKCENVLYNTDYQVVLNKCTIADYTKKLYCYAGGEHYECDDNKFLDILSKSDGNQSEEDYTDSSGANTPELETNMVPIKYDGTNWVYADTNERYYDKYTYNTSDTTHERGKLGDATKETLSTTGTTSGGWYGDYTYFVYSDNPWFIRGGGYDGEVRSGLFRFNRSSGNNNNDRSVRAILIP